MKRNLFILILTLLTSPIFAQTGEIKGTVKTSDNQPASFVNIYLKDTQKGTTTDKDGHFLIGNIKEGKYILVSSYVGLKKKEISVQVSSGETTIIPDLILEVNYDELKEVIINGQKTNKYAETESKYVAKLPLDYLENPQVYNSIDATLLKEQVVTNFNDALQNAPGLTRLWESTGRGGDGAGYYSLRGFSVQPTMINGLPGLTNGALDPANIERIEVIKGPSGTLFGSSLISYGGLINVVTKRPYKGAGGEINYITGSFGLNRITADINTPLNDRQNSFLRINGAYHSENSFQDAGFKKSFYIAPSLSYEVNDRLSFLVNTEFLSAESTNPLMLFLNRSTKATYSSMDEIPYYFNNSYTSNDLTIKTPTFSLQGQMLYKLSEHWTSQTALSRSSSKSDGYYSYLYEYSHLYDIEGSVFSRFLNKQNSTTISTDIQQNFIGDFNIGTVRNRLVVGFDYFHKQVINNGTGYISDGTIYIGNADVADVNNNVYGITNEDDYILDYDNGTLSQAGVDALLASTSISNSTATQEVLSAYASDVVTIMENLSVMASLRIDRFIDKDNIDNDQTALSPKFGAVYQLIPNQLSVFSNYMNGFSNVSPKVQADQTIASFDPEQANQWEIGTKLNILNDRIAATISYYDIQVKDIVMEDPSRSTDGNVYYIQAGKQYSKGIELSIIANPIQGLNLVAGYSHNDSEVENTSEEYNGRRPESAGPEDMVNFWASYTVSKGALNGFGVGFGGNYASEYFTLNRLTTGQFSLPSYTILNASVYYDNPSVRIALKINNMTDEHYYKGWSTANPQKTKNISASLAYKF